MPFRASDRSYVFVPGNDRDAVATARGTDADALILDLEDGVGTEGKADARRVTRAVLADADEGDATHIVRINGLETEWGAADLDALIDAERPPDAVMLPNVRGAADVERVADRLANVEAVGGVVPLIERPEAVFAAEAIATASPGVVAVAFGHGDFEYHLGTLAAAAETDLSLPRMRVSMAASIAGVPAIDTPHVARDDIEGLRRSATEAKRLGFDGKMTFLHDQIGAINETFSPSPEAVEQSRRVVAAFEATDDEEGVSYVDGEFVDKPVVDAHRERLDRAEKRGMSTR